MKIKTKMVEDNTYICENCNSEYCWQGSISKCDCCGKEICEDCRIRKTVYYIDRHLESLFYVNEGLCLCRKCYDKISDKYDKYVKTFNKKELELKNKLNKITDDFLEGIKNDQI